MNAEQPDDTRPWYRHVNWYLTAIPPAVLVAVVLSGYVRYPYGRVQRILEYPAPFLLGAAAALYAVRSAVTRNPLFPILTLLTITLTCREIHFAGTSAGVYFALAAVAVWMVAWRKRIAQPLRDGRHISWLIAACATYCWSNLVERRIFGPKYLNLIPNEKLIHSVIEEVLETVGHLLMLTSSLLGGWRRYGGPKSKDDPGAPSPAAGAVGDCPSRKPDTWAGQT